MGCEIERKFLVTGSEYKKCIKPVFCRQGYLTADVERTVRIRIEDDKAYITIKGKNINLTRLEYQYEIPLMDGQEMLNKLCKNVLVEKYRYNISYEGKLWEVDEFIGENQGLIIAEIELEFEDEKFEKPTWVGEEVSFDKKYSNSNLYSIPYKKWRK